MESFNNSGELGFIVGILILKFQKLSQSNLEILVNLKFDGQNPPLLLYIVLI